MKFLCYTTAVIVCLGLCVLTIFNIAWTDGHLQIMEKEKKIVLKGQISKALGEYDSHLKGAVEYLFCGPNGKQYESIIVVDATAKEIYEAMNKLGVKPGNPVDQDMETEEKIPAKGPTVIINVEWTDGKETKKVRGEDLLYNVKTKKPMKRVAWMYTGSRMVYDLDGEDEDAMIPLAFSSNDIVALNHADPSTLFINPLPESEEENLYKKNDDLLPELGTPVKLTIEVNPKMQLYVLISGKVQGVHFRNFTRSNAKQLGINGYAKNLKNGKVEVVAEGDKLQLDALLKKLRQGPPASRVDDVKIEERAFTDEYKSFSIKY